MQSETGKRFRKRFALRRVNGRPGQGQAFVRVGGEEHPVGVYWRNPQGWWGITDNGTRLGPVPERRALIRTMDYLMFEASHRRVTS